MTKSALTLLVLAGACFVAFQLYVEFMLEPTFFGVSAIFLSLNLIVVIILMFLTQSEGGNSIIDLINQLEQGEPIQYPPDSKTLAEVIAEESSEQYSLTRTHIYDLFTLEKAQDKETSPVGGGLQYLFTRNQTPASKAFWFVAGYILALAILVAYSLLSWFTTDHGDQGIINSVCIVSLDIVIYFYIYARLSQGPLEASIIAFIIRLFIVIFAWDIWFVGYCCIYYIFAIILIIDILSLHFPILTVTTTKVVTDKVKKDVSKTPQFVLGLLTLEFLILIGVTELADLSESSITGFDAWKAGLATIGVTVVSYFVIGSLWLLYRKVKGIEDGVQYYFYFAKLDTYWTYVLFTVLSVWAIALLSFFLDDNFAALILMIFLPVIWALWITSFYHYVQNDYSILMDAAAYNFKIQKNREIEIAIIQKVKAYQDVFLKQAAEQPALMGKSVNLAAQMIQVGKLPDSEPLTEERLDSKSQLNIEVHRAKTGLIDPSLLESQIPQPLFNWRESMGFCSAFCRGKLHSNDYTIIICNIFIIALTIFMAVLLSAIETDLTYGPSTSNMIAVITLAFFPLSEYFATAKPFSAKDYASLALCLILNYGYGVLYILVQMNGDNSSTTENLCLLFTVFFLPVVVSYAIVLLKLSSDTWRLSTFAYGFGAAAQVFAVLFALAVGFLFNWRLGGIMFGVLGLLFIFLIILRSFLSNNYKLPLWAKVVLFVTCSGVCVTSIIVGVYVDSLGKFVGFTVTYFSIILLIGSAVFFKVLRDFKRRDTAPLFFSPWVFPIYRYDPVQDRLVSYNITGALIYFVLGLGVIWSVVCVIWLSPASIGIAVGCLSEVLICLVSIYIAGISPLQLGAATTLLNFKDHPQEVKRAWLECKKDYLTIKGATYPDDFPNYQDRLSKLSSINRLIAAAKSNTQVEIEDLATNKAWTELPPKDLRELLFLLFCEDDQLSKQYTDELELMIHFQLLLVVGAFSFRKQEIMFLSSFIKSKQVELRAFGIDINLRSGGSLVEKYTSAKVQIKKLDPIKRFRLEALKEQFQEENKEEKRKAEIRSEVEIEAQKQRKQKLAQLQEERQRLKIQQESAEVPLDQMVDSPEKFRKIVERYRATGEKYVDTSFKADANSLGPNASQQVSDWRRAGEECVLYEGTASPQDVKQGALGDCYFLSAMAVLGNERIESLFVDEKPDPKCGAYCIRFTIEDQETYVIIDTLFPVNSEGNWAFASSITETEIWPMCLEKAYAKVYGGYDNITAGKVHYALADLTGGSPEEIKLESIKNNPTSFWNKFLSFKKMNYLMGAGSPENERGDSAVSQSGIVQGHAYAILDVVELEKERLVQLKNPHGQHGVEWNGDWSDSSFKWTKLFKQKLNYQDSADGIFWMSFEDFVWEFKNLYVCRIFPTKAWLKLPKVEDVWEGREAAGLPSRANPRAVFGDNPQYQLTLTKPCTIFIELTQKETVDMFKGKLPILVMVFNSPTRVDQPNQNLVGSTGSPTDLKIISTEIRCEKAGSYIIMPATMFQGEKGYGSYKLEVTVEDFQAKLAKLPLK
eukprot:CAMPEP_0204912218 /NCGR_PEP_ID=MMETSP1397-20131031/10410_1 /ASSEMBLY_ACC=CAM_ASM_000891 /TAXON_ID=49980 /ORGANISM="Climacostomum Climacostomum virens, Strain Stock W-24" /LENGTH=1540 /DNA_ID=CAMNT_0052083079 /DNA_START=351 /DNA_END=4973 /DNA_ORIENTATION=-